MTKPELLTVHMVTLLQIGSIRVIGATASFLSVNEYIIVNIIYIIVTIVKDKMRYHNKS